VPREFLPHASRVQILEQIGLDSTAVADAVIARLA
jgi:1-deoxy-D-xylulose-5-phosphate synthase